MSFTYKFVKFHSHFPFIMSICLKFTGMLIIRGMLTMLTISRYSKVILVSLDKVLYNIYLYAAADCTERDRGR